MNKIKINDSDEIKTIELAAETLAKILLQQVLSRKNPEPYKRIENKYDKSNS